MQSSPALAQAQTRFKLFSTSGNLLIALLLLLCALTRWLAIPASLWEWDDILFARALHRFDLMTHSPHPPGFPVFVVLTRCAYWLLRNEQRALTTTAFVFGVLLAPALFYLYQEIFRDRLVAVAGALLGSFTPAIWVYSCTGRSDGPALVISVIAATLLLRGRDSRRALLLGCAVLGLGMGVRVTVLPVAAPILAIVLLLRLRRREWRLALLAVGLTAFCALCWYVPMIVHQGWEQYRWAVARHGEFIWRSDSLFADTENGVLIYRLRRFFVDVWGDAWIMWTLYGLSLLGVVVLLLRREARALGWLAVGFLPFMAFTFISITPQGAPLYAMPYLLFFSGLAACGLVLGGRLLFNEARWPRLAHVGFWLACGLAVAFGEWTYPIIKMLHGQASPSLRALHHLQKTLDPQKDILVFEGVFNPHVGFFLSQQRKQQLEAEMLPELNLINLLTDRPRAIYLTEQRSSFHQSLDFSWKSKRGERRLKTLSLGRYFEAHVTERTGERGVIFLEGWWGRESTPETAWRWMAPRSRVALLGAAETMRLRFKGGSAFPPTPERRPTITLRLNGVEIDRFTLDKQHFDRTLTVQPDPARFWSTLAIEIDKTAVPHQLNQQSPDKRELGLSCNLLEWTPAPGSPSIIKSPDQYLGEGWNVLETSDANAWRWMKGTSLTHLPAIEGDGQLTLRMAMPSQPDGKLPDVSVEVAGQLIEKFQPPEGDFTKTIVVPAAAHGGKLVDLKISTRPVIPQQDPREFGISVAYLGWRPLPKTLTP